MSKQSKTLKMLLKKAEWLLTKPILGYGERARLEAIAKRIRLSLEPEDPEAIAADAIALINVIAESEPLREAKVQTNAA